MNSYKTKTMKKGTKLRRFECVSHNHEWSDYFEIGKTYTELSKAEYKLKEGIPTKKLICLRNGKKVFGFYSYWVNPTDFKEVKSCKCENATWNNDIGCLVCDNCNSRVKQVL